MSVDAGEAIGQSKGLPSVVRVFLALLAGALYPLAFAPFDLVPLLGVSIALLFWLLLQAPARSIFLAWVFGLGKYAVGVSWIYVSIHQYGGASPFLAFFLVAVFVAFMALFCLPLGWIMGAMQRAPRNFSSLSLSLVFIAAWVLMEWLLTWLLTGFPWLFAGHATLGTPLQGYAPVVGALGLSLLVVACSVAGLLLLSARRALYKRGLALLFVLAVFALGGFLDTRTWVEPVGRYSAALVQANIDQAVKWNADQRMVNVDKHLQLSQAHWDADLLVWPEFALTVYGDDAKQVTEQLQQQGQAQRTNVVIGMPDLRWLDQNNYQLFNSAQGFGLATGRFVKHHLVPFGDYVPLQDYLRGVIEFFDLPMSAASRGARQQDNILLQLPGLEQSTEVAMGICYEIAYGDMLRRHAISSGVLLTISNDTWFGGSIGPHQHMQIARMRALENGRWLLRATNNGVSAVVNERGEVQAKLPQSEAAVLRSEFAVVSGTTPYTTLGDWPVLALALTMLLAALSLRGQSRQG